jgi:hypothetical protein
MNPIYKFSIRANGATRQVFPIYGDGLSKDFEKESGQEFFRAKLSGGLTFESADYDFIVAQAFDEQFVLEIAISYDAGVTLIPYWRGTFWKTDCKFDDDAKTVVVKPSVYDQYSDVLAGLDKEYNLIDLAPAIAPVKADKRPMIQVYVPGQSVIGCFLAGMWWEQECTPESDEFVLAQIGDGKLNFELNKSLLIAEVTGAFTPGVPDIFTGEFQGAKFDPAQFGTQTFTNGDYSLEYSLTQNAEDITLSWTIIQSSTQTALFRYQTLIADIGQVPRLPETLTLTPVVGSGATGEVELYLHEMPVYSRYICDTQTIGGAQTFEIGANDIVPDNRNYRRVVGYNFPDTIYFSDRITATPTRWGLYQPGKYYQIPYLYWGPELFPIARNAWGRVSIWFTFSALDPLIEPSGREPFTIRHAYPLYSVISVLLGQIAPGITHGNNTSYSEFLYGQNLLGVTQTLLITPKSNIISAGYDQPAQKAPITLRAVLDMLRDCFRCYWFVDDAGRFRIEHIEYFRNGGSYSGTPVVGVDLTTETVPRTGKQWAYARNQYEYEKPEMAARYQFGWADNVTELFTGHPINILSRYVNPDNIQQISVAQFTSDIDFVLLNPETISKDGFVLLAGEDKNELTVPETYTLQGNDYVNFRYPMPEEWKGNDAKIRFTLSGGSAFFRVYLSDGSYNQYDFVAGTIETVIPIPADSKSFLLYGTAGQTVEFTFLGIGAFALPYINWTENGNDHYLQNAYVAFCFLQQYYAYDMPAPDYEINGVQMTAIGVKRLKTQTIRFPALVDPDLLQLIETNMGAGTIGKLSVNLSSRNANATLKYDTE